MDKYALHKLARRVALALILALQTAHFVLQMLDQWGPPRKEKPKLTTLAKVTELGYLSISFFTFVERNIDLKIGRHVVQGLGMDALLWCSVVWSAAVVRNDSMGFADKWLSLMQLMVVDVLMWAGMLWRGVDWVEREDVRQSQSVVDEKVSEEVNEKMSV